MSKVILNAIIAYSNVLGRSGRPFQPRLSSWLRTILTSHRIRQNAANSETICALPSKMKTIKAKKHTPTPSIISAPWLAFWRSSLGVGSSHFICSSLCDRRLHDSQEWLPSLPFLLRRLSSKFAFCLSQVHTSGNDIIKWSQSNNLVSI